jgi:uncharacterized metal-binding protein
MATLTTAARIRNRIKASESDISDAVLTEFIADEQAYIEGYAEMAFAESDSQFNLARSVCTDRCAAKALLHIAGISAGIIYSIDELKIDKSDRAATKLSMARDIWDRAKEQLLLLKPASSLRPRSSTA